MPATRVPNELPGAGLLKLDLVLPARSQQTLAATKTTLVYADNEQRKCDDEGHHHGPEKHLVHSTPRDNANSVTQASQRVTPFFLAGSAPSFVRAGIPDSGQTVLRIAMTRMSVQDCRYCS